MHMWGGGWGGVVLRMTPHLTDIREISHSELHTFKSCKRRWYITYYLELSPDPARASPVGTMHVGTRIHTALEAWYGYQINPIAVLNWDYDQVIFERPDFLAELERERDLGVLMLEGYLEWSESEGIDAGYVIVATEHEERATITTASGDEVVLRGKLDQVVRRESDGALLARDFKTVAVLERPEMLVLGTQLRHYALLQALNARETGQRIEGGQFIMLRRVKRSQNSKPPFFATVEVHLNRNDLNSYYLHAREVTNEILRARTRLDAGEDYRSVAYTTPSDFCNWGCAYKLQCPLLDDGSRWQDALATSFSHCNPYARYESDKIQDIRRALG